MLKHIVKYLLIVGGLVVGLMAFHIDVFARMAQYPHLEMAIMPLQILIGIAAIIKLIHCCMPSCRCCMPRSCGPCPDKK